MKTSINNLYNNLFSVNISKRLATETIERGSLDSLVLNKDNIETEQPEIRLFEDRIASLVGGTEAIAVHSLEKAYHLLLGNLLAKGDNIVAFNSTKFHLGYGKKLKESGVGVKYVYSKEPNNLEDQINENTKIILVETLNQHSVIPDFIKIVNIAKAHNIPVIVDNSRTYLGFFARPFLYGASFIIEEVDPLFKTKDYNAILIDSGKYDWKKGNFQKLNSESEPKDDEFSLIEFLRDKNNSLITSTTIKPNALSVVANLDSAFNILRNQGKKTLELARWLAKHKEVKNVNYLGLASHKSHFKALTYLRNGYGTELSFQIKGDLRKFEIFTARLSQYNYPSVFKIELDLENSSINLKVDSAGIEEILKVLKFAFSHIKGPKKKEAAAAHKRNRNGGLLNSFAEVIQ